MTTVRELHRQAMELAQNATFLPEVSSRESRELLQRALELESQAAAMVDKVQSSEPTRSILYRSAASLAIQAQDYEAAIRLSSEGMAGYPDRDIQNDLFELIEQARIELERLALGDLLPGPHLKMRLRGRSVGFGSIPYSVLKPRMETIIKLLTRTSMRLQNLPYQSSGSPKDANQLFVPMVNAFNPGSFEVEIELAPRQLELTLPAETVINAVIDGIAMIQSGDTEHLGQIIDDDSYTRDFFSSARTLAPDGNVIRSVVFNGSQQILDFTRRGREIAIPSLRAPVDAVGDAEITHVEGRLVATDIREEKHWIGIEIKKGQVHRYYVPEGLEDLVKTHLNQIVSGKIETFGKRSSIVDVTPVEINAANDNQMRLFADLAN
jgi:hypothetical protein